MKTPEEELNQYGWLLHGIGFLFTGVVSFVAFAFLVTPMQFKFASAERAINQLNVFLGRSNEVIAREGEMRRQLESSRDELRLLQNRVPRTPQADQFLKQLDDLAKDSGLTILDYQPGKTISNETHSETQIELSGKGGYINLCRFLEGLVGLPRLCRIRTMQIQSVSEGGEYPVDLSLSIYFSDSESFVRLAPVDDFEPFEPFGPQPGRQRQQIATRKLVTQ